MQIQLAPPKLGRLGIVRRRRQAHGRHQAGRILLAVDVEGPALIAGDVPERLAVLGQEGVEVHQRPDPVRASRRDPGDHHPAIGVTHQDHVLQVLVFKHIDHVLDVDAERDAGTGKVRTFAQAREGGDPDLMALGPHQPGGLGVAPSARPGAVHQ